jgi:hypothetical protein
MKQLILFLIPVAMFTGCTTVPPSGHAPAMKSALYQERPTLETSLFRSDQEVLSEEAIKTILDSKLVLPQKAKLAIMKFPGAEGMAVKYYGYDYLRAEGYLKTQQEYIDSLSQKLINSDRIIEVTLLPSLLTPKDATTPVLREAAVRLQSNLLLVFRVTSDIYQQYKWLAKDKVKAFSTVEVILLDVKTGLIPYTSVVTRESTKFKETSDFDINETRKRAEKEAVLASLNTIANDVSEFFSSVP